MKTKEYFTKEQKAASLLGRLGGKSRSAKKILSVKNNLKLARQKLAKKRLNMATKKQVKSFPQENESI